MNLTFPNKLTFSSYWSTRSTQKACSVRYNSSLGKMTTNWHCENLKLHDQLREPAEENGCEQLCGKEKPVRVQAWWDTARNMKKLRDEVFL